MADYRDIVTNRDMIAIANAIRHATRTTEKMTVPQMPERLSKLRVIEWSKKTLNFATGEAAVVGTYSIDFKHLFLVSPCSSQDAESLSNVDPELELAFNDETGVLSLPFGRQRNVDVEVFVIDMLLSNDADNGGMLVPYGGPSRVEAYDATKAYRVGDLYIYQSLLGLTLIDHEAEEFDASHNVVFASEEAVNAIFNRVSAIELLIPAQASYLNKLADKDFVNSSINSMAAFFITKNAQGDSFATKAELDSATVFYSGGVVRVPTQNDYCLVIADETKTDPVTEETPTTRYIYQNDRFEYQYTVNKTPLTAAQLAALNSGITALKVLDLDLNTAARHSHTNKAVLDLITAAFKTEDKTALDAVVQQAVRVVDQSLTEQQRAKARANIGAVPATTASSEVVQSVALGDDGIEVTSEVTDTNEDGTVTRAKTSTIPVVVGDGLSAVVSGSTVIIDTVGTKKAAIQLQTASQVQGTLTDEAYATLTADHSNYIETSYGDDKKRYDFEGESSTRLEYAYKHDEDGIFNIESLKIDKSTKGWAVSAVEIQEKLTFDNAPTENSTNPVTSGGIFADQTRQDVAIQKTAIRTHNLERVVFGEIATEGDETYKELKNAIIPGSIGVDGSEYPVYDEISSPLSKVKGNTKQFNQLALPITTTVEQAGITKTWDSTNNCFIINGTSTRSSISDDIRLSNAVSLVSGHKYLYGIVRNDNNIKVYDSWSDNANYPVNGLTIRERTATTGTLYMQIANGVTVSNVKVYIWYIDLTAMGEEDTTVSAFRVKFPKNSYQYNAGTLYDSVISGVELKGADKTTVTGTISLPSTQTLGGVGTAQDEIQVTKNTNDDYYTIKKYVRKQQSALSAIPQWNQLVSLRDSSAHQGITTSFASGLFSFSGTTTTSYVECFTARRFFTGRKYYIYVKITANPNLVSVNFGALGSGVGIYLPNDITTGIGQSINTASNTADANVGLQHLSSNEDLTGLAGYFCLFDLTAIFGKGNEPMTVADVPQWIKDKDYFSYKAIGSGVDVSQKHNYLYNNDDDVAWTGASTETVITTTATLAEVSAIRENGGMISVVGNTNEDYAQPDVEMGVSYSKTALA